MEGKGWQCCMVYGDELVVSAGERKKEDGG